MSKPDAKTFRTLSVGVKAACDSTVAGGSARPAIINAPRATARDAPLANALTLIFLVIVGFPVLVKSTDMNTPSLATQSRLPHKNNSHGRYGTNTPKRPRVIAAVTSAVLFR